MTIFYILLLVSLFIYLAFSIIFYNGLSNSHGKTFSLKRPMVSVVIAARNEEKNLPNLLTYLKNQDYPNDLYEVIISDDNSTDNTENIVNMFQKKWKNLIYLKVKDRDNFKSPKKNAITKGINKSRGEIILLTDADCFVSKKWISSIVMNFTDDTDMVCGFSRTYIKNWNKAPLIQKFEFFDFSAMYFAAAGAISKGLYFSCSGQNISYRKKAFLELGGFSKINHIQSGDDVNLLQIFRKNNKKIKFSFSYNSFVYTKPISSTISFINQRSRWASNYKYQSSLNILFFIYLSFVFILTCFIFILPFINIYIWLSIILIKFLSDFFVISKGFKVFKIDKNRLNFFPIWFFIQPVYILFVTFLGLFEFFKWKK